MKMNGSCQSYFENIYTRYNRVTFTNALRICKCPHASEEVVQEVFLRLWIKNEYLDEIEDLESYLFMMTRNVTISLLRKENRYLQALSEYGTFTQQPEVEEGYSPELEACISEAAEQLAPRQKLVYKMRTEQRLRRLEIAECLDISPNTVRNTLQKSIRSITRYVQKKLEG